MDVSYRGADAWPLYAHTFGAGPATVLLHGGGPDHRSLPALVVPGADARHPSRLAAEVARALPRGHLASACVSAERAPRYARTD